MTGWRIVITVKMKRRTVSQQDHWTVIQLGLGSRKERRGERGVEGGRRNKGGVEGGGRGKGGRGVQGGREWRVV